MAAFLVRGCYGISDYGVSIGYGVSGTEIGYGVDIDYGVSGTDMDSGYGVSGTEMGYGWA
eukprot:440858-Rhodomonas_salina.1